MNRATPSKKTESRVAEDIFLTPHHKILSLEVIGGFLGDIRLDFADGLNCIIGGRGSGKTTVLEFLRYGLNAMPDRDIAPKQHDQITNLIEANLGTGRLKITVQTKEGLKYIVEREVNESATMFDERGNLVEVWPGSVIDTEVYSQNEIEDIANTPHFQLNLIDKFVKAEVAEIDGKLREVSRNLDENADVIIRLEQDIRALSGEQRELALLQERLKKFQPLVKGDAAQILQTEINKRATREKENRLIERLSNYLTQVTTEIGAIEAPFKEKTKNALKYFDSEFAGQDNTELMKELRSAFATCVDHADTGMTKTASALKGFVDALPTYSDRLESAHKVQEQKYQDVLRKHEAERGRAQEQAQLHKKLIELQEKKRDLDEKSKTIKTRKQDREKLLKRLSELHDERWECRERVAKMLNSHLAPHIRVTIVRCGDRTAYKGLLKENLKGRGGWYTTLADKIGDELSPSEFVELIQSENAEQLVDRLDIELDKAQWLIEQLRAPEKVFRIQAIEVDDKPSIQLKDGEYKDASALSIGQKCTTILPILLWGSASPLIVDQPEDNLDNNFIYETVVTRIEEAQKERQMIFVTHNPNIPVLGEASRVFGLKSNGQKGSLDKCGTVDEVKDFIETFLEGGHEAFMRRKEKYGIRDK